MPVVVDSTKRAVIGNNRITYTDTFVGGGGTVVGPGAARGGAPGLATHAGSGLSGTFQYAFSEVTLTGESLPSPLATISVGVSPSTVPGYSYDGSGNGFGLGGFAIGDTVEFKYSYSRASGKLDFSLEDPVSVSSGVQTLREFDHAGYIETPTISVPYSTDLSIAWIHVWMSHNGGAFKNLFADDDGSWTNAIPNNSAGGTKSWKLDPRDTGDTIPTAAQQVAVMGIATGQSGVVIARNVYRTAANASQLKLLTTLADNVTTALVDSAADGSLGANAPTVDTSGLAQPDGQVLPGATALLLCGTGAFRSAGGYVNVGDQSIRYTGVDGNTLTGIPSSGNGSIMATITFGATAIAAPLLLGIPASGPDSIQYPITKGDAVNLLVRVDDTDAQAEVASMIGNGSDGVIEDYQAISGLTRAEAIAQATADLELRSTVEVRLKYTCREPKTGAGKIVHVNLTNPNPVAITGDFLIQQVNLSMFRAGGLYPTYEVQASNKRFTFEDALRKALKA